MQTIDYRDQATKLLENWHALLKSQITERVPTMVSNLFDIWKAERILHFSQKTHGLEQNNLTLEGLLILSLTTWTTDIIDQNLDFSLKGVKNGKNGKSIALHPDIAREVNRYLERVYAHPKEIVDRSGTYYPRQLLTYYGNLSRTDRDIVSRATQRRFFEYGTRRPLDGKSQIDWHLSGKIPPYFANLLDSIFPEKSIDLLDAGEYFVLFTENELIIETPSKKVLSIEVNEKYRKIFHEGMKDSTSSEAEQTIEALSADISKHIQSLVYIPNNIRSLQTDMGIQSSPEIWDRMWFAENHDCAHISDPFVMESLKRILGFFGNAIPRYFPYSLANVPGDYLWKIQIYSFNGAHQSLPRIKKASEDLTYFQDRFLTWLDRWEYGFLNWLIEEIYEKRWLQWADEGLVYNILATIYRHLLVDVEKKDGKKCQKWESDIKEWLNLVKDVEASKNIIAKIKSLWLYKKWITEQMVWLKMFVYYGYRTYLTHTPRKNDNTIDVTTTSVSTDLGIPKEIQEFFQKLFLQKKEKR